jgi:hypothetical protein
MNNVPFIFLGKNGLSVSMKKWPMKVSDMIIPRRDPFRKGLQNFRIQMEINI